MQVTPRLLLASNAPTAASWLDNVSIVSDNFTGLGGLAGVEAALARGQDALVVAWDMPFVVPDLLQALVTASRAQDASAVVPQSLTSPFGFEPFCAFYSVRVHAALREFLGRGGGAARDFVDALDGVHHLPANEVATFGDPRRLFFSVNTPDDLARARAMASAQ